MRSANIDDISKAVGINRAIIYRHFASKEELFALTLADYLAELGERLAAVDDPEAAPHERAIAVSREFATYCLRYPAFVDCALALLGRPGADLLDEISDGALHRLSLLMGAQLGRITAIIRLSAAARSGAADDAAGVADVDGFGPADFDADLLANALYMQVLGLMHLARSGVVLRALPGGAVSWDVVEQDRIVDLVTRMTLAVGGLAEPPAAP
jgi:AcrR family transcriptional regulator